MTQLTKEYNELWTGGSIFIDDDRKQTVLKIASTARRVSLEAKVGLIVIDYSVPPRSLIAASAGAFTQRWSEYPRA
jgi:replicative DNA helicase